VKRICFFLILIALAACTRFVVLDPSPDANSDGHGLPDAAQFPDGGQFPDAAIVKDAGTLD
jgi:hypothetical protein